jgi:hypothetical protein
MLEIYCNVECKVGIWQVMSPLYAELQLLSLQTAEVSSGTLPIKATFLSIGNQDFDRLIFLMYLRLTDSLTGDTSVLKSGQSA